MCGFAGLFAPDRRPVAQSDVAAMIDVIRHRGPDGDGFHREPGVGLGFCRLAIVDVAGGAQPLSNEDGQLWLVYNGEIYNHKELRAELSERGHRFRSRCDSEVIVHGYEQWGAGVVERLRGMFAFCVWDRRRREVFLARDRSGIKPLYVRRHAGAVYFASEAKALLVARDAPRALDLLGYTGLLEIEPLWERTPFEGIRQLGPGCVAHFGEQGEQARRYWAYAPTTDPAGGDAASFVTGFRRELARAVAEQMTSDVLVGAYLSGGVDSAAVVGCMSRISADPVRTYTTTSTGVGKDESFARLCAARFGASSRFVPYEPSREAAALLPFVAWMSEGEFDSGYVSRYCLARAAREDGVKVILTGQGIDEVLTGYFGSFREFLLQRLRATMEARCAPAYRGYPPFGERVLSALDAGRGGADAGARCAADGLREEHGALSPGLLRFEDRMGMAAGVEVRVPLLDHRLLELCASIPPALRPDLLSAKAILRRAARPWIPRAVAVRPKFAFNGTLLPLSRLVELQGPHAEEMRSLFSEKAIAEKGYFDVPSVAAMWREGMYEALDHVLIVQLMDELFVSRFDPDRFRGPAPAIQTASAPEIDTARPRPLSLRPRPARVDHVPALSPSVTQLRFVSTPDRSTGRLQPVQAVVVDFAESSRDPVLVPLASLGILGLVDGARSFGQIARRLGGRLSVEDVLVFAQHLESAGVITSSRHKATDRSDVPSTALDESIGTHG